MPEQDDIRRMAAEINPKTGKRYKGYELAEHFGVSPQRISYVVRRKKNPKRVAAGMRKKEKYLAKDPDYFKKMSLKARSLRVHD